MNEKLTSDFLDLANSTLEELLTDVLTEEGTLAGGIKLDVGGAALDTLRQTQVTFGNPKDKLTHLTPDLFASIGVVLDDLQKRQLNDFDFYYMTMPVTFKPGNGVQLSRLTCQINFGTRANGEPIVQNLFPRSEWKEVLNWGGGMKLGLTGALEWGAEVVVPTNFNGFTLPGSITANLANKNELKAFIAIPDYRYSLGRADIAAAGVGNNFAFWDLTQPDLKQMQDVFFGVVFKTPRGMQTIELEGLALAEPSYPWLVACLSHLFGALGQRWIDLLTRTPEERKDSERMAHSDREKWTITLPV